MISPELMTRYSAAREACPHRISGALPMTMADQLAAIAEQAKQFDSPDVYGTGELIESFEIEIAEPMGQRARHCLASRWRPSVAVHSSLRPLPGRNFRTV